MSKFVHFIAEVTARFKGDEAGVVAARNASVAESGINLQISAQKHELVKLNISLDKVQDELKNAKYPTVAITDAEFYVKSISIANDRVVDVQNKISDAEDNLEFLNALLTEFEQDGVDRNVDK